MKTAELPYLLTFWLFPFGFYIIFKSLRCNCDSSYQTFPVQASTEMSTSHYYILIDFSLTVKATTLIFISGRGSTISSAKEGKSGFINLKS